MSTSDVSTAPKRPAARVLPARPLAAAVFMAVVVAFLWVLEFVDQTFLGESLDGYGIEARQLDGLDGILFAPVLHHGYEHLASNTVPLLVLGFLVLAGGFGQFVAVTAFVWLVGGAATWLTGAEGFTVGASGIIFGWLAFLLVRGFLARSARQIVLALVLFVVYGGLLWGVLPTQAGVSWQGHLFGALAGIVAARLTVSADRAAAARV